ncbi:hydroxymethylglutaryl-CoA synthase [Weissella diestrammenae]|uniref:Hydroxymethylglutaryl-CoA synthase n=1 Tax=Weissella diestrammenae TaxID=1162633 RepID=A0A7G9T5Y9_9LACO|nr:hydroxymethylglutaryl-CoA synthase [Weissella diestrammenae]MCM0582346.1 hydroxymethylglutaryl-CoA synthase [Weissella diestrammenae]QNN75514.1 hydroxymethylglutaryl-CoA synthase [Weissella diestrammenae]
MTKIGIDRMSFFSPHLYIDMTDLALARHEEPDKFLIGIGQSEQAVIPPTQDVVTMAANAADQILTDDDRQAIDLILFATESGIDNSKSGAVYVQRLLGMNRYARTIELKQACYAGTFGLMTARDYIKAHPGKKVLVLATDIARYGLQSSGEVTQGGGAVAMIVSENPKIAVLENDNQYQSEDIMDFWRPVYATEALVDGKYSSEVYQTFFKDLWQRYQKNSQKTIADFNAFVFHLPFTKLGLKALRQILPEANDERQNQLLANFEASRVFNRRIGNLYTGSIYLSLMSLLLNSETLQSGDRIGLFSYGSGAEGEFFSAIIQPEYRTGMVTNQFEQLFAHRQRVSITMYEGIYQAALLESSDQSLNHADDPAKFILTGLKNQQRQYETH